MDNVDRVIQDSQYWIDLLTLQHWELVFKKVRAEHFANPHEVNGENHCNREGLQAVVFLKDPLDDHKEDPFLYDEEKTLVHELLHCVFAPISDFVDDDETHFHIAIEQAINVLARAFVRQRREARTGAVNKVPCSPVEESPGTLRYHQNNGGGRGINQDANGAFVEIKHPVSSGGRI